MRRPHAKNSKNITIKACTKLALPIPEDFKIKKKNYKKILFRMLKIYHVAVLNRIVGKKIRHALPLRF